MNITLPEKVQCLFKPYRYKVMRGGRGGAKSWSAATALLVQGAAESLRVLCAREVQLSIKQSVHQLLSDQIKRYKLYQYTILDNEIRGRNGTAFYFTGLNTQTIDSIKSFEGIDRVWIEEGQVISDRSLDILIPTIRKDGSEIWITYNPELETDPVHRRFTLNPPPDCVNVEINWRDNPWFPEVLDKERLYCKAHNPDEYDHIWEGKCRPAVEGAIYYKEVQRMFDESRVCLIPNDPVLRTHVVMDLGWEDSVAIGMVQRSTSEIRIIDYLEDNQKTLADYSRMLKDRDYNWGKIWLPWDGYAKRVETGKSSEDVLRSLGWDVATRQESTFLGVEEGIKNVRLTFPRIYIDKGCEKLIESLKRYRRNVNKSTGAPGKPVHDEFSHGADMLRYLCLNVDNFQNSGFGQVDALYQRVLEPEYVDVF